jgi:hypothetical protein
MQEAHFKKITACISTRVNFLIFRGGTALQKGCPNLFDDAISIKGLWLIEIV